MRKAYWNILVDHGGLKPKVVEVGVDHPRELDEEIEHLLKTHPRCEIILRGNGMIRARYTGWHIAEDVAYDTLRPWDYDENSREVLDQLELLIFDMKQRADIVEGGFLFKGSKILHPITGCSDASIIQEYIER